MKLVRQRIIGSLSVLGMLFFLCTTSCARYEITGKGGSKKSLPEGKKIANPGDTCVERYDGNSAICENADGSFRISATPYRTNVNMAINFEGTCMGNGAGITIAWEFADGSNAQGFMLNHAYAQPGTYKVRATCLQNNQAIRSGTLTLQITGGGSVNPYPDGTDPNQNPHQN